MTRKQRRLTLIGAGLGVLGLAAAPVLFALKKAENSYGLAGANNKDTVPGEVIAEFGH